MKESMFYDFVDQFGSYQKRSMFGGIGLFNEGAMYALITNETIFIRGGGNLDKKLVELGCEKYKHVKKQTTAIVNYYDITDLFDAMHEELESIVRASINFSKQQRAFQKSKDSRRLRDLPNMQLTLERMVKKSGVEDVSTFMRLGPVDVFRRVKQTYGGEVDIRLLWKFAGAVKGCHWKLIQEQQKDELLALCQEA
ncbi:DNA transformation protein [Vibrio sp. vnigr-6D03]|uniref:DNA transformation protein n=1 Tax=Vibrio penaeicida TaxID=104609 RepID=A0AAV5NXS4_9VIBR|nr:MULTISPECIES: TfoX/Sxy family DNA transformation protein [Vibrio]MDP2571307.1 TfoX/Sxy family DNA transformation protein [Vibrio penaeicida]PKF77068.1 DNA transformation protein [Vibrio sp. vnigr-6D03]RTZ18827.1 TfoX family DNA transformation protein [Vibrio penaeicida]GLQ75501.1 DNA transformation protein [Vibrio penaeicida]